MSRVEIESLAKGKHPNPEGLIDYRYLNLDTNVFEKDAKTLAERFRYTQHLCRVIPSDFQHNQILVAAGSKEFTVQEAIERCRILSGIKK